MSTSSSRKSWDKAPILPVSFYRRDTIEVAQDLLGKILVVRPEKGRSGMTAVRIVETEAYLGDDPASHSARGETPRSSVMFGEPAVAYVYFIYGMYEMLNFVAAPQGVPGAVLIRAAEPLAGQEAMFQRRKKTRNPLDLTRGPGRLCQALGIEMSDNRKSLLGPRLEVRDDGFVPDSVSVSPRVGIRVGTERPWRFFITGSLWVSRAPENSRSIVLRSEG